MAQQFLLRGATLEDATRQAAELYGAAARIVRAERVLDGGLGGFLGRRHIEVTVHVPDDGDPAVVAVEPAVPHVLTGRAGIAALLDDADRTEDEFRTVAGPAASPDGAVPARPPGAASAARADAPAAGEPSFGGWAIGEPTQGNPTAEEQTAARAAGLRSAAREAGAACPEAVSEPGSAVSTQAVGFDELLERLRSEVVLESRVPSVLSAPGDLVLVAGLGDTAFGVARDMARDGSRWELWSASTESSAPVPAGVAPSRLLHADPDLGAADFSDSEPDRLPLPNASLGGLRLGRRRLGGDPLGSRRDAEAARARGVETETAAVVACSLGSVADGLPLLGLAGELGADQVWLVVDARHKPDETADWVADACARLPVAALAVLGAGETRSAHSINSLGIPVGWVDGSPAPRTVL